MLSLCSWLVTLPLSYGQINDDGVTHGVSAAGIYTDLTLPMNPLITEITFSLKGGDGGSAKVIHIDTISQDIIIPVPYISNGGEGASVEATFPVGNSMGEIPPGSTIRFVEGIHGSSLTIYGSGITYGGGGGGSAVLFEPPEHNGWTLLAVAGGGGGAFQRVDVNGGNTGDNGDGGFRVLDGVGTDGGGSTNYAGGGGGATSAGEDVSMLCSSSGGESGGFSGGLGGFCAGSSIPSSLGGSGYGGGGAGVGAGGGGGGYFGGNGGGDGAFFPLGHPSGYGGGSYVHTWSSNSNSTDGFNTNTPENGEILYQVTLNDPPIAKCEDITIYLDTMGWATLQESDIEAGSYDPDGTIESKVLTRTYFTCYDVGENQVPLIVTDNEGGKDTCYAVVTVLDTIAPVAVCRNVTLTLNPSGEESIVANQLDGGSTDACNIKTFEASQTDFTSADIGENVVVLTVTDYNGNSSTCEATVTIPDNIPPSVICQEITVYLESDGTAMIMASEVDNGSTDTEGIRSMKLNDSTFTCQDIGPNEVELTVTDINGNIATCTTTVNVVDGTAPFALCWQNTDIYLDASGQATLDPLDLDAGSTDNCGIATRSLDVTEVSCSDVGNSVQVKLTLKDHSGNQLDCQSTVTVIDTVSPTVTTRDLTVYLDGNGRVTIEENDVDNNSMDACGISTMALDKHEFTCTDLGEHTVELTVTDVHGNSGSGSATVTVLDTISPLVQCKEGDTIYLNPLGTASIAPVDVVEDISDNCTIETLSLEQSDFDCGDLGENRILLTVEDYSGNEATCVAIVTLLDTISPEIYAKNISVNLGPSGYTTISASDVDNGSWDACGIETLEVFPFEFTCVDLGPNTVILKGTDVNGNTDSIEAEVVVVIDNPVVRTRDVTIVLNKEGGAEVRPEDIDAGSTAFGSKINMWLEGQTEYDCGDEGVHEVQLKVEDQSGNIRTGYAQVTVSFFEPDFKNIHDVTNGDTIHVVDCQAPWDISRNDLDYETIKKYGTVTTNVYKEELPKNAPWGMYAIWRYEYVVKDACYHTYKLNYYLAFYDLAPPIYQDFPNDTTVATAAEVPPVDKEVKIIDVCQYAEWDTVMTKPVIDLTSSDTIGYTRRWMARDPSGHESFKNQMIWLGSGNRNQYALITGRIADENHIRRAKFTGEAGTNGLPISLYRLDEDTGTRTWVNSWTTGDWMGAQGRYYFVPEHPGSYQVKIDSAICLVDTLKFDKDLWSDTLEITAGESLDQGWIITHPCTGVDVIETLASRDARPDKPGTRLTIQDQMGNNDWKLYPNPASGYLRLEINSHQQFNYRLYDALGRSVKSGVYERGQIIDIHRLNTGVYHFQLLDKDLLLGTKKVLLMN